MDPLRSDMRPTEALTGAERDARIEQLLLSGLDEYFAHRYENAISLWTRVLFFDRHHDRARAYIERARRAQAERQRESDAVLHQGIEAFRAGDVVRARQLLADALDRGASPDEAQGVLERIERLGVPQAAPKTRRRSIITGSASIAPPGTGAFETTRPQHARGWAAALLLATAAVGVLAVGTWGVTVPDPWGWSLFSSAPGRSTDVVRWAPEPLPLARASETYVSRARALVATGRLHDALAVLDRVPVGDSLYKDAERLRAEVQERLLAIALPGQSRPSTAPGER